MTLLALILVAAPPAQPPPALHVPKAVREARKAEEEVPPLSVFASPEVLAALGPPRAQVGAWAEYAVRPEGQPAQRLKISVLPPALEDGRYWLEIDLATEDGNFTAVRLLVHGDPGKPEDLERATLWVPGQAPLDLPLEELRAPLKDDPAAPPRATVLTRKAQSVQTRAGAFAGAEVLEVEGTRLWRSPKVPLWGLVKARGKRQSMELIGYASKGAHTLIQGIGSDNTK